MASHTVNWVENVPVSDAWSGGKPTTIVLGRFERGDFRISPTQMLSNYLRDNWNSIEIGGSVPSFSGGFDINRIKWNQWFSGYGDFTLKVKEQYTFVNTRDFDGPFAVLPFGGRYHLYHSAIDVHIFQRTTKTYVSPPEISQIALGIDKFIQQRPYALKEEGIIMLRPGKVENVPTGDDQLYHYIITVHTYYYKTDLEQEVILDKGMMPLVESLLDAPDRLMEFMIETLWPQKPNQVLWPDLPTRDRVRFRQQYKTGDLQFDIQSLSHDRDYWPPGSRVDNVITMMLKAIVFQAAKPYPAKYLWPIRSFMEKLFRIQSRADYLAPYGIDMLSLTQIFEEDNIGQTDSENHMIDQFVLLFRVQMVLQTKMNRVI